MLEVFDTIARMNEKEALKLLLIATKKYPLLPVLLKLYISDSDKVITPWKIYAMMKYYRVEKNSSINNIGEIGIFTANRMILLREKEFGWKGDVNRIEINMSNVQFLIDTYKKLKLEVTHKNQYKIMKKCFELISHTDVIWFTRMLCGKFKKRQSFNELIMKNEVM